MRVTHSRSFLRVSLALLLLTTMLITPSSQSCGEGCLSCTQSDETGDKSCQVCDLYNQYVKAFDGTCEKKEVENCEIGSLDHFAQPCLLCLPGYILDIVQGKCVSVNFSKIVPNCHRYSNISTCLSCVSGHYISFGQCIKSEVEVPDCLFYSDEGICSECILDRFLDKDLNTCSEFPEAIGCSEYNTLNCDECKPGFAQDKNFYMRQELSISNTQSLALAFSNFSQISSSMDDNCFPLNVPHCEVHENADTCLKCETGYFVDDDRKCTKYPNNRISNCKIYEDKDNCKECDILFKLNGNKCVRRVLVDHCVQYEIDGDDCIKCEDSHYESGGSCTERSGFVDNCMTHNDDNEECATCKEGFIKNTVSNTCFSEVLNCKVHQNDHTNLGYRKCSECDDDYFLLDDVLSYKCTKFIYQPYCKDRNMTNNKCTDCSTGYYNDDGECKPYTVDFCEEFEDDSDECETCIEGFEKDGTECKPIELNNCVEPSLTEGQCETCIDGFYKDASGICRMRNLVGCKTPVTNQNICSECSFGYSKDDTDDLCYRETDPHCTTRVKGFCTLCEGEFEPNDLGICHKKLFDDSTCATTANGVCTSCSDMNAKYINPILGECTNRDNTTCATYETHADLCITCASGKYLVGGKCEDVTIVLDGAGGKCTALVAGKNECSACTAGNYLNSFTKTCQTNFADNCQSPTTSSGFGCATCNPGYWHNPQTMLCERGSLPHCVTYANDTTCSACENHAILLNGRCTIDFLLGCHTLNTNTSSNATCTTCFKGFYKDGNICKIRNIPYCKSYNNQTNACIECFDGYYPHDTLPKCVKFDIPNCLKHTYNSSETPKVKCVECENLYYINTGSNHVCTSIGNNDCVMSVGTATSASCSVCKPGFKTESNGCTAVTSSYFKDKHCFGNGSSDDKYCDTCQSNFMLYNMNYALVQMPYACIEVDASDPYKCLQCKENFELTSTNLCSAITTDVACNLIASSITTGAAAVSGTANCLGCSDYDKYYLAGASGCAERARTYGCMENDKNTDTCLKCSAPLNDLLAANSRPFCHEVTSSVSNCAVYSKDGSTCQVCDIGYTGSTCASSTTIIDFPSSGIYGDIGTKYTAASALVGASTAVSGGLTKTGNFSIVPKTIASSNVYVIDHSDSDYGASMFNFDTQKYEIGSLNLVGETPVEPSTLTWIDTTTVSNCAIGIIIASNFHCMACKNGFFPKYKSDSSAKTSYVKECASSNPLGTTKQYTGYTYSDETVDLDTNNEYLYLGLKSFMTYDTCPSGKYLVYYIYHWDQAISHTIPGIFDGKNNGMECLSNIHSDNVIDGCHAYAWISQDLGETPIIEYSLSDKVKCAGCKPGYKGSGGVANDQPGAHFYTTCTAIENCDLGSSENTMMNACGKCKTGYAWDVDSTNKKIIMHSCVKASDNCKVYDSFLSHCRLCEAGYLLNDVYECVLAADMDCTTPGIDMPDYLGMDLNTSTDKNLIFSLLSHFYLSRKLSANNINMFCDTCKSGFLPVIETSPQAKFCIYDSANILDNCKYYQGATTAACSECNDEYYLDTNDNSCHPSSLYPEMEHCLKTNSSTLSLSTCLSCKEGYTVHSAFKTCIENDNCLKINSTDGICLTCKSGSFLDPFSKECVEAPLDSECEQWYVSEYSGSGRKYCMKCKDPTQVPINFDDIDSSDETQFQCIDNVFDIPDVINPALFEGTFVSETNRSQLEIYDDDGNKVSQLISTATYLGSTGVCGPVFGNKLNCEEYDFINKKCSRCSIRYFNNDGQCMPGDILNCEKYEKHGTVNMLTQTCLLCSPGHFLDKNEDATKFHSNKCVIRTKECEEYDPYSDNCLTCPIGRYLDTSTTPTAVCTTYTDTVNNCQVLNPIDDSCMICSPGYFLDPDTAGVCLPIKLNNCATYSVHGDVCTSCFEGFYLDVSTKCIPHTSWNCKVYSQSRDACEVCEEGYYKNEEGKCLENTLEGCSFPMSNQNKCSLCMEGYWMDLETSLCHPHTVLHCSIFDQLSNKCLACDSSSYMNSSDVCVEYSTALNCYSFHPTKDECTSCLEGFYFSSGTCTQYSMNSCRTYNLTENKCTSCHDSFYLDDSDKLCKPITSTNCAQYSVSSNRCSLCMESHYLDLTSGNCYFYTVENCQEYHPYKNQCSTCMLGYYITDTFNCQEHTAPGCSSYSVNSDHCVSCKNGFYLDVLNQKCLPYTAEYCVSYRLQEDKCSSCLPSHYLSNGMCKWYTVSNCAKNDSSSDRCIGCIPGHYFVAGKCMEYTVENCKDYEEESDKCTSCMPNHYLEFGHCFEYTVENCATFESKKDLCLACDFSSGKIFRNPENNFCEQVTEVENCEMYDTSNGECMECVLGFYLEDDECHVNPTGIPMCEEYNDDDQCSLCEPGSYLLNNVCITPEQEIHGCHRYSSEDCCQVCESNFAITSEFKCEPTIMTGCATWSDPDNCASCSGNEVLVLNSTDNNICQASGINNCDEAVSSSGGIICISCETGYFPNDGQTECLWPETLVEHCLEYSDHGVCSRCIDNYLLSKDNDQCTSDIATVGPNCMVGHISDKPKCSRCLGGFYFDDSGVCQECSENMDGCSLCDINNLSRCLICAKDYYMTEDFTCEKYPDPPVVPIGIDIIRMVAMALLSLILLK